MQIEHEFFVFLKLLFAYSLVSPNHYYYYYYYYYYYIILLYYYHEKKVTSEITQKKFV